MSSTSPAYVAIAFKPAQPTEDFSCSEEVELPGQHVTQEDAWAALRSALQAADYIGGTVRPAQSLCGNECGKGCGKPLRI